MIRSKSRNGCSPNGWNPNGFSLIEVMVALVIVSMIIITVLRVQANLTRTTVRTVNRVRITILMKNFLIEMEQQKKKEKEQMVDGPPPVKLSYQLKSLKKQAEFEKIPDLFLETVTAQWQEQKEQKKTLVSIVFRPKAQGEQGA